MFSDMGIELTHIPFGGGREFHSAGQGLVSEFAHQVPERDILAGFGEGGSGTFDVETVHFLASQALQQVEILNRDDGGEVLPTAGNNRALFAVGRAVHEFGELFPRF